MAAVDTAVALSFLIGSLLFTADGVVYLAETGGTAHAILYTGGSILFVLGSSLLLLQPKISN